MDAEAPRILRPPREIEVEQPHNWEDALRLKESYYRQFELSELRDHIATFRRSRPFLSEEGYFERLEALLRPTDGGSIIPYSWDEIPRGSTLLRVREMTRKQVLEGHFVPSDLWEPPAAHVRGGRFNASGEPLLYTCLGMPRGTFAEARITEANQGFLLCFYFVEHPLIVRRIGEANPDKGLSKHHREIEQTITTFLAEEACARGDKKGRTHDHTRRILRQFFALEPHWEHGWVFASTLDSEVVNVALLPDAARRRIRFDVGIFGSLQELPDGTVGQSFAGYTDGEPRIGSYIGIAEFDHTRMNSIEDYYHFLGYSTHS